MRLRPRHPKRSVSDQDNLESDQDANSDKRAPSVRRSTKRPRAGSSIASTESCVTPSTDDYVSSAQASISSDGTSPLTSEYSSPAEDAPKRKYRRRPQVVKAPSPPVVKKPRARGSPPAFAHSRQALCDAFPWFKSHQGGTYTHDGIVYGLYMDKFACIRDCMSEDVIITHIGGGRSKNDSATGHGRSADQKKTHNHIAWAASQDLHQFILVIIGRRLPGCPVEVEFEFNVLDFFMVTDLWWEVDEAGFKFAKLKLQRINKKTLAWWVPDTEQEVNKPKNAASKPSRSVCRVCSRESKQIFQQAWCCLNENCAEFFEFPSEIDQSVLRYSEAFLSERVDYRGTAFLSTDDMQTFKESPESRPSLLATCERKDPPPLIPSLPSPGSDGTGSEKTFRMGSVCPACRCCSRRKYWSGWVCENPGCGKDIASPMQILPIRDLDMPVSLESLIAKEIIPPLVMETVSTDSLPGYIVRQFLLRNQTGVLQGQDRDAIVGTVTHFKADAKTCATANGPNDLWEKIQVCAAEGNWCRGAVRHAGLPGEILTRNFLQNYGAPYKYTGSLTGKGFQATPDPIFSALNRLTWAGRGAVQKSSASLEGRLDISPNLDDDFIDFNEILSLGYFEDDCISWHDDGEYELGPTVATLSLGSPSTMSFRPKNPRGQKGITRRTVLRVALGHGDMIVMHGAEIHRCFEHRVDPFGPRRFALTSRHIVLDRITEEQRAQATELGRIPDRARLPHLQYHGEDY